MSESYVRNVIEAALLAAGKPLPVSELPQLFDEDERPDRRSCARRSMRWPPSTQGRGIELKETASGFRIQVRRDYAAEVSRLWPERPRATRARCSRHWR